MCRTQYFGMDKSTSPAPDRLMRVDQRLVHAVDQLEGQRPKLLRPYYDDRTGADLFAEEEARLALAIAAGHGEADARREVAKADDVGR
jgi:hypothetical protein